MELVAHAQEERAAFVESARILRGKPAARDDVAEAARVVKYPGEPYECVQVAQAADAVFYFGFLDEDAVAVFFAPAILLVEQVAYGVAREARGAQLGGEGE